MVNRFVSALTVSSVLSLGLLVSVSAVSTAAAAQVAFYEGKTIRIISPSRVGGGPDTRARLIVRHLPSFLPGQPRMIVQNMPGAGGVIAANFLFNVVEPDGLTLGVLSREVTFIQMAEREGVQYNTGKFAWVGSLLHQGQIVFIRSDLPYLSLDELRAAKEPLVFGSRAVGSVNFLAGKALEMLGVPVRLIPGYGSSQLDLAFEQGEVDATALSFNSLTRRADWVKPGGLARPIVEIGTRAAPDVPAGQNFAPMAGHEQSYALINAALSLPSGSLAAPPGTPSERVESLREAFAKMVMDPEFQVAARKINLSLRFLVGEDLAKSYRDFLDASPDTKALFKQLTQ